MAFIPHSVRTASIAQPVYLPRSPALRPIDQRNSYPRAVVSSMGQESGLLNARYLLQGRDPLLDRRVGGAHGVGQSPPVLGLGVDAHLGHGVVEAHDLVSGLRRAVL